MKNLKIQQAGEITLGNFELTKTGLIVTGRPTFREWVLVGEFIKRANSASKMWLGDWINYGETRYGEKYTQAIDETELDYQALRNAAYVSRQVLPAVRHVELSYSHHVEVASLKSDEQNQFLTACAEKGWTKQQLRSKVREYRRLKGIIGLEKVFADNVSLKLINADFGTNSEQIGSFQLALWELNPEIYTDHALLVTLFGELYKATEEAGMIVLFVSPGAIATVTTAVSHIDSPVWVCAVQKDTEIIVERNVSNSFTAAIIFRKHPKRSFLSTLKDTSSQRTVVEALADEARRVLIYRPEDTYLPQMLFDKEIVILEPSPKYYQLLKGHNE